MRVQSNLAPIAVPPSRGADAGQAFEAWFVGHLVHEMQGAMGGLFGDGAASAFSGLFEQELGRRIAEGPGLGLARQIQGAIDPSGVSAHVSNVSTDTSTPSGARLTSGFGARRDPFDGGVRAHHGIDLAAAEGTPIRAARDGVVVSAGARGGYGNLVVLDHGDGTETRYAHCEALGVTPGQVVRAGDAIATVGATGRATGAHLHFELREGGRAVDPGALARDVIGAAARPPASHGIGGSSAQAGPSVEHSAATLEGLP